MSKTVDLNAAVTIRFFGEAQQKLTWREAIKKAFSYNPDTGEITRLLATSWKSVNFVGKAVGSPSGTGHLVVSLGGRPFLVHRLAYFLMKDEFPPADIDHINGVRSDNRWSNLRACSRSENMRNYTTSPRNGCRGITFNKMAKKWEARIWLPGRRINLGLFKSKDDAIAARIQSVTKHYGEFAGPQTNEEVAAMKGQSR